MSMIKLEGVDFSYPSSLVPVFSGLTFTADESWKTGLVGANGSGKTTLFKILCKEEPCGGRVLSSARFCRFPQNISYDKPVSALTDGCPEAEKWQFVRELTLLGLGEDVLCRPIGSLSGGERTKAMLAALFCSDGFPLIDEPTDSLDLAGRRRLAAYLKGKRGYIVASHDRAFLNACTDHTLFLSKGKAEVICGSYSVWKEERDAYLAAAAAEKRRLEGEAERLYAAARRTEVWAAKAERSKMGIQKKSGLKADKGFVSANAARVMKRSVIAAARRTEAAENAKKLAAELPQEAAKLTFPPCICRKQCVLSLNNADIFLQGEKLLGGLTLSVRPGERVAVTGNNGCGKSTLLKAVVSLAGGLPEDTFDLGGAAAEGVSGADGVKISYVSQNCEDVCGTPSQYAKKWGIEDAAFKSMLAKLGFFSADWSRDMSLLSTGQRKKAALARSMLTPAHLYVWDEPFNYLDVDAREMTEAAVLSSSPSMIFVEHDEEFVNRVATRTVRL